MRKETVRTACRRETYFMCHSLTLAISLAGQYDNPIPTRFLAHKDYLKIPARYKINRRT
jgi:hypothetical protein